MKTKIASLALLLTLIFPIMAKSQVKIQQTAGRDALGEFAPEFARLNDDILFGEVWTGGNADSVAAGSLEAYAQTIIFPVGKPNDAYAKYFIGQSYTAPVVTDGVPVVNVTFEPGCRNNWHVHKATKGGGQTLVCVGGRGYYQEWGKEPVELHSGDAINIPAGVKHWHGAAPDSWFSHLAIEVPGENNSTEWLEPVGDEEYAKLK